VCIRPGQLIRPSPLIPTPPPSPLPLYLAYEGMRVVCMYTLISVHFGNKDNNSSFHSKCFLVYDRPLLTQRFCSNDKMERVQESSQIIDDDNCLTSFFCIIYGTLHQLFRFEPRIGRKHCVQHTTTTSPYSPQCE
jgi:hypothetical protein